MKTIKGPAIFLAQFMGDDVPFDSLENLAGWASGLGYKAIQLPCDPRLFDLEQAADSTRMADYAALIRPTCFRWPFNFAVFD